MKKQLTIGMLSLILGIFLAMPALADGGVYYVEWGDSLSSIATHYGVSPEAIMAANGLDNPDFIYVGQKLLIPGAGYANTGSGYYTVEVGDTLGSIAEMYNTTSMALASANGLGDADFIYTGQVLSVPGAGNGATYSNVNLPAYKCGSYYNVDWGDTLSGIAWHYGVPLNLLLQANNLYSDSIYEGQRLCIPSVNYSSPPKKATFYHTVKAGETVTGIAYYYGIAYSRIIQANNLANNGLIYQGQRLVIPGKKPYKPPVVKDKADNAPPPPEYVEHPPQEQETGCYPPSHISGEIDMWCVAGVTSGPDPYDISALIVRTAGATRTPIHIKGMGHNALLYPGDAPDYGADYLYLPVPPGDYMVSIGGEYSEKIKVTVEHGRRAWVEFNLITLSTSENPSAQNGWIGRVVSNSGGLVPANGVSSVIIVRGPAKGLPIHLNISNGRCYTGTKPEYGHAACDFGGLWPGWYKITLLGADVTVDVYVDGVGVAEVEFEEVN